MFSPFYGSYGRSETKIFRQWKELESQASSRFCSRSRSFGESNMKLCNTFLDLLCILRQTIPLLHFWLTRKMFLCPHFIRVFSFYYVNNCGSTASSGLFFCTDPVWLVKTRMQLQNPLHQAQPYSGYMVCPSILICSLGYILS